MKRLVHTMWAQPSSVLLKVKSPDHISSNTFVHEVNILFEFRRYRERTPSCSVITNPSSSRSISLIGTSPVLNARDREPAKVDSSTSTVDSTWLFDQSKSANPDPATVTLTWTGPDSFMRWAKEICEAPWPMTRGIAVDDTKTQPRPL